MYDIYIKNYLNNSGATVTKETLLYSIPIKTEEHVKNALIDPTLKNEMGKTGTLEFSVHPDHPWYNRWMQMRTIMRVVYDGTTIYRGRVLTIDNGLMGIKKIHLEGDMAFLMDSYQEGVVESKREEMSVNSYITTLLKNHRDQMDEDDNKDKRIYVGWIPGNYPSGIANVQKVTVPDGKFGNSGYESTMKALETLTSDYGGYFRTRWEDGKCYLDWLNTWFDNNVNGQPIEVSENLVEMSNSAEVDNIFTAVVPIGKGDGGDELFIDGYKTDIHGDNKRILVPQLTSIFSDSKLNSGYHTKAEYENAINKYGIIYKIQKFDNANTQDLLWEYATDWMLENYFGGITSFDVTALDMHHINGTVQKYLVGDRVKVIYPDLSNRNSAGVPTKITKSLTISAVQYYLHNPEKNTYTVGIPSSVVSKYGVSTSKGGSGSKQGGGNKKMLEDEIAESDCRYKEYLVNAKTYFYNEYYRSQNSLWQKMVNAHPEDEEAAIRTGTIYLANGLTIADPTTPTSHKQHHDKTLATMFIDAETASINVQKAIPESVRNPEILNWIENNYEDFNKANQSMVFDGMVQQVGFKNAVDVWSGMAVTDMADAVKQLKEDNLNLKLGLEPKTELGKRTQAFLEMNDANEQAKKTVTIFGGGGIVNSIVSSLGLDGSGEKATVLTDGLTSVLKFFNPGAVKTDPKTAETIIEIDGANGTGNYGKSGNTDRPWKVKLNAPVTYTDKDGNKQTVKDGFVCADDFNIPEVASFKTKLLVVDNLIADKASINDLEAAKARIDKLEADAITAKTIKATLSNLDFVTVKSLYIGTTKIGLMNRTMVTGVTFTAPSLNRTANHYFLYASSQEGRTPTGSANGALVTSWSAGSCDVDSVTEDMWVATDA